MQTTQKKAEEARHGALIARTDDLASKQKEDISLGWEDDIHELLEICDFPKVRKCALRATATELKSQLQQDKQAQQGCSDLLPRFMSTIVASQTQMGLEHQDG